MDPPGLRRLRFPFFKPLVKEQVISAQRPERTVRLSPPRREEDEADRLVRPGKPRVNPEIAAHWSRTGTGRARDCK